MANAPDQTSLPHQVLVELQACSRARVALAASQERRLDLDLGNSVVADPALSHTDQIHLFALGKRTVDTASQNGSTITSLGGRLHVLEATATELARHYEVDRVSSGDPSNGRTLPRYTCPFTLYRGAHLAHQIERRGWGHIATAMRSVGILRERVQDNCCQNLIPLEPGVHEMYDRIKNLVMVPPMAILSDAIVFEVGLLEEVLGMSVGGAHLLRSTRRGYYWGMELNGIAVDIVSFAKEVQHMGPTLTCGRAVYSARHTCLHQDGLPSLPEARTGLGLPFVVMANLRRYCRLDDGEIDAGPPAAPSNFSSRLEAMTLLCNLWACQVPDSPQQSANATSTFVPTVDRPFAPADDDQQPSSATSMSLSPPSQFTGRVGCVDHQPNDVHSAITEDMLFEDDCYPSYDDDIPSNFIVIYDDVDDPLKQDGCGTSDYNCDIEDKPSAEALAARARILASLPPSRVSLWVKDQVARNENLADPEESAPS